MPTLKNAQHEKFVQEIVKGKSQGDAYLAAGYKAKNELVASAAATRLLKDVKIVARLSELQRKAEEKVVIDRAWVLHRLVENVERAMTARAAVDEDGNPVGVYKYEGSVANRALELLGKEMGMFVDRKEIGGPGDFEMMDDAALREHIANEMAAAQEMLIESKKTARGKPSTKH
jgi:hypothetical protein